MEAPQGNWRLFTYHLGLLSWLSAFFCMTFVKYLTKRRIDYVTASLEEDPDADIHELFNYVGYRQHSTAWRNFQKVTGVTPAEFIDKVK
jgi:YesN/AraC family two-component response regulator